MGEVEEKKDRGQHENVICNKTATTELYTGEDALYLDGSLPISSEVQCEAGPLTSAPEGNESSVQGAAGTPPQTNGLGCAPFKRLW